MRLSQISSDFNRLNKSLRRLGETLAQNIENLAESTLKTGRDSFWHTAWAALPNKPWVENILNRIKPAIHGMGLRVTHFSGKSMQAVLPAKRRNLGRFETLQEGLLLTAAVECSQMLLLEALHMQVADTSALRMDFSDVQLQVHFPIKSDVILRLEISDALRESIWSQLEVNKIARVQWMVQFFDQDERLAAALNATVIIEMSELLSWK